MVIRTLTAADFDAVLAGFNTAFSDYLVPLTLTAEQLSEMLRRRGWAPEASVAAFEDDRIVAFTLNGVEDDRAYDTGTGVAPTHRRQGLAREMMLRSFDILRERGCKEYVLEVLDQNHGAVALYRDLGFRETRGLQCWRLEAAEAPSERCAPLSRSACEPFNLWWDMTPAWQNSTRSIERAADPHLTLGNDDGYVVVFPSSGDVPQLAVRPEARRRGLGSRLLHEAADVAGKPLRIMCIDDREAGIAAFLERAGAAKTVREWEMVRAL